MKQDIAEIEMIVRGLSEGQHAVLMETQPNRPRLYVAAPGIPRVALFSKGLLQAYGDVDELPLRFELTNLGVAVQAHLLAHSYTEKTA